MKRPVRSPKPRSSSSIMRAVRRLAVGPGEVDRPVGPLRLAEQVEQGGDALARRADAPLAPATGDSASTWRSRAAYFSASVATTRQSTATPRDASVTVAAGRPARPRCGRCSACGRGQRGPAPSPTTASGALPVNSSLPSLAALASRSFSAAASSLASRARSAATSIVAGQVELDATPPAVVSEAVAANRRSGSSRRSSVRTAGSAPRVGAGQPGRHAGGRLDALVGAEPAHLGDDGLHRQRSRPRRPGSIARRVGGRPVGDRPPTRRRSATSTAPRSRTARTDAAGAAARRAPRRARAGSSAPVGRPSEILASSTYQSQTSSHAKW